MNTLEIFNENIYQNILDKHFDELKNITYLTSKEELEESKPIYDLLLKSTEQLYNGDFDIRYYYKEIIKYRDSIIDKINFIVERSSEKEYIEINRLYNEWRVIIHSIGDYIGEEFSKYVSELEKYELKEEEKKESLNELKELENIENILKEI